MFTNMTSDTISNIYKRAISLVVFVSVLVIAFGSSGCLAADPHRDPNNNFASVPTTIKTYPNDTVLLPCHHSSAHTYIRWIREDILLLDTRHPDLLLPARMTLFANGSLQVSNVEKMDTAEYVCEVGTSGGMATQTHAIEVQYAPSILSVPSGTVEVKEGSSFEIVCEARGVPQPIITWQQNGLSRTDELDNTRRMLVNVRDRHMAGPIECIAKNGVGEATAGITLIVQFPPEVKATTNIVHSKISLRAYLECEVIAQPAAVVHWFHNGFPVTSHHRIAQQNSDLSSSETLYHKHSKHVLIIKRVQDSDLGIYECRAANSLGTKGVQLELTGRPMPPVFRVSPKANTPMTHNLVWQTESLSPLIEYILRFRQVPSGNVTPHNRHHHGISHDWMNLVIPSEEGDGPTHTIGYNLRGLMPATVYEYSVTARNRYGLSDSSIIKRFATGGEIEMPNYSTETIDYDRLDSHSDDFSTTEDVGNVMQSPEPSYSDYSPAISGQMAIGGASAFSIGCCVALFTVWISLK